MILGYARVSTQKQKDIGNGITIQKMQLAESGAEYIIEDVCSGNSVSRPGLDKLLEMAQCGDTVLITSADRLARDAHKAGWIFDYLMLKGVKLQALDYGEISERLLAESLFSECEKERKVILERTKNGREFAKQRGKKFGRPMKYSKIEMERARKILETHSYNQTVKITGIPKATLARYMRKLKEEDSQ